MASSSSANRALCLSLAVITAILFVITASRRLTGTSATPGRSVTGSPSAAAASQSPGGTARRPSKTPSHIVGNDQRVPVSKAPPRAGAGVRGAAAPNVPTMLTIDSPQGRAILSAPIDPMAASHNQDGSWAPIEPPSLSRAVWMSQSAPPAAPSSGTTAIYGHACIGLSCVFNNAVNTPLGSIVTLETNRTVLRYRVVSITQYPKTGAASLASRPNIANQLLLITCAYRPDQSSVNNLVIVATLIAAGNR